MEIVHENLISIQLFHYNVASNLSLFKVSTNFSDTTKTETEFDNVEQILFIFYNHSLYHLISNNNESCGKNAISCVKLEQNIETGKIDEEFSCLDNWISTYLENLDKLSFQKIKNFSLNTSFIEIVQHIIKQTANWN